MGGFHEKRKNKNCFSLPAWFSASQAEGDPVHRDLAKKYNANLYLSRLAEHGIDRGDSSMINLTAEEYEASAEKALAIAEKLGDEVVVMGTSAGGTLAIYLASRHPEIKQPFSIPHVSNSTIEQQLYSINPGDYRLPGWFLEDL